MSLKFPMIFTRFSCSFVWCRQSKFGFRFSADTRILTMWFCLSLRWKCYTNDRIDQQFQLYFDSVIDLIPYRLTLPIKHYASTSTYFGVNEPLDPKLCFQLKVERTSEILFSNIVHQVLAPTKGTFFFREPPLVVKCMACGLIPFTTTLG